MADDSIQIVEPFEFHPADSPRGMLYYDLHILTGEQQSQLNDFKRNLIRDNEKYLASHPEVRALVALVTRHVLRNRPRSDLHEFVGRFFSRPKPDIQEEVQQYIEDREPHVYEGDSAVIIREESSEGASEPVSFRVEEEEEEPDLEAVPRKVLDEILEKAYARLGINVDDMGDWVSANVNTDRTSDSVVNKVISEILKGSGGSGEFIPVLTYLEDGASQKEDLENSVAEVAAPPVSETTDTSTDTVLEIIPVEAIQEEVEEPKQEAIEESKQEAIEEPKEEAIEEPKQEAIEEPKQETIEESKQEAIEEPKEEAIEEPKQEAIEESKQEGVEQSPQELAAIVEETKEETVVNSDQPQIEESNAVQE